ncbi:uncharacterized protein [Leptinotarsa decemlineata]|uniref:uncharacterized protein n=1 Tax=Leptinotarsa decemlineata TaxID=7539 RepID=UPI000C252787|nr:uncharacterized protein LOC111512697 [Leptinotarsa decemlineata]
MKMVALKLLTFVALVYTANASTDRELALKLASCLKKVIISGLPSLHIPSHDPLVFNHNLSWHGDIGIASGTLNVTNLVWHGIPNWSVDIEQFSDDSDSNAILKYTLWWPKFVFTSKYSLYANVALIPTHFAGDLNVTLASTTWSGEVNFTKPGFNLIEGVEGLTLSWNSVQVHFDFTGLGPFNGMVSNTLSGFVKGFLDTGAMGNTLGEALKTRLNTAWFQHNERIDKILEYCRNN